MAMRVTGMMSGMDTESIIQELVAVKQTKVDDMKKKQTKLEWKQDAWKELNTKIKKFYNSTLDSLRFQSSYSKKITKVSNSSVADIITADSAMNSVQKLKVDKLAQTGYLTGGEVKKEGGFKCTSGTKLTDIVDKDGNRIEAGSRIEVNVNGKTTEITITDSMTVAGFVSELNNAGVNANFDSKTQRFFIGAKESGEEADFTITAANENGTDALNKLGILVYDNAAKAKYTEYAELNDAGNEDKLQAIIDAEAATRLAKYISRRDGLQTKMEELSEKYAEKYADEILADVVNNTDVEALKSEIETAEARIKELTDKKEEGELTEDEQRELDNRKEEVETKQAKLDYIESYKSAKEELTEVSSYINDDNTASAKLTGEVETWLNEKIDEAESILAGSLTGSTGAHKTEGQNAEIHLNGAKFTSTGNTFEINGLTITCNAATNGEEVTLTTQDDTSGIYDMIKNFIKEYSSLINEMDKLYNADAAKGYEPLTDDEKDAMSEKEVEKWEEKIKDSLLRRDSTLNTVSSAFREIMSSGFTVGGKTMYLSDFGIETLGYFEAEENEHNAYHIYGDEDDSAVSGKTNELKSMISTDPDAVMDFFTQLTKKLYEKTTSLMASVKDYSSAYTVYEDKKMKSDYDDYTKKIAELEKKLTEYEDKWYKKFSAMETAMAKMQSNASAITGLLGG